MHIVQDGLVKSLEPPMNVTPVLQNSGIETATAEVADSQ